MECFLEYFEVLRIWREKFLKNAEKFLMQKAQSWILVKPQRRGYEFN
jgi:hypothetical protein